MQVRKSAKHSWSGMSLLSLMVALALTGVLTMIITQTIMHGFQGAKSTMIRFDISTLRKLILDNFDCGESLGNPAQSILPLVCSNYPTIPIRGKSGANLLGVGGKIGEWTITAGCSGNQIIFQLSSPGKDPFTGQEWVNSPALRNPTTHTPDMFRGTGGFCLNYFGSTGETYVDYSLAQLLTPPLSFNETKQLTYQTKNADDLNEYDSTTGVFTAKRSGIYSYKADIIVGNYFPNYGFTSSLSLTLQINGAAAAENSLTLFIGNEASITTPTINTTLRLQSGDAVTLALNLRCGLAGPCNSINNAGQLSSTLARVQVYRIR